MRMTPTFLMLLGAVSLAACAPYPAKISGSATRGQLIYAKECSQCHGAAGTGAGSVSPSPGNAAPALTRLALNNNGSFPRDYVQRFVMGLSNRENPAAAMPEFKNVGLRHVYPQGGADGEVLEADFEDLLDYLDSIQE